MSERVLERRSGERGFALVLAILSLMLLTFLGLTLASTTSTELQIATNYRWSQQALYNAEAGLEAARVALANLGVVDPVNGWLNTLPIRRMSGGVPVTWAITGPAPGPDSGETPTGRDFEKSSCDARGGGMGYGRVLVDDTGTRLEDVSSFEGQTLNGAFTVWIRRPLFPTTDGQFQDGEAANNSQAIIVAEGVAPYSGAGTAFTRANQAVRVLEVSYELAQSTVGDPCETYGGQEGYGPSGEGYNPCAYLDRTQTAGALNQLFDGNGVGSLDAVDVP
jgi:hypothetical protein